MNYGLHTCWLSHPNPPFENYYPDSAGKIIIWKNGHYGYIKKSFCIKKFIVMKTVVKTFKMIYTVFVFDILTPFLINLIPFERYYYFYINLCPNVWQKYVGKWRYKRSNITTNFQLVAQFIEIYILKLVLPVVPKKYSSLN